MELAAAMKAVELIAAKGGAYGLAHRARNLAATLTIAKSLEQGVTAANATNLAE